MTKKICVVGGGYWGQNHINTLDRQGSLHGIVDVNKDQLANYSKKFPNVKIFESLDDSLRTNFDGYIIATPANTHYEIAKKIINAGFHLLVEKPFCLNLDEANELVEHAKDKAVKIMVGHVLLFHPAIIKIKEIIKNGRIGKLSYIYSNRLNLGKVRTHEDVLWSLSPHDISIFQFLINFFPSSIKANGFSILQHGIADKTILQLEYPNGVSGHIFSSWLHPFKEHKLIIIGTKGMISFEDSKKGRPLIVYDKSYQLEDGLPTKFDNDFEIIEYGNEQPLDEELKYFIKAIDGKTIKKSGEKSAIEVTKILIEATKKIYGKLT